MNPVSRGGLWTMLQRLFAAKSERDLADDEQSWRDLEEDRQIEAVRARLNRVKEQLAGLDERREQRG